MAYSNPLMYANSQNIFPFWKKVESNFGFIVLGLMFAALMFGFINTTDSEDPSVMGDVVVEQAYKYPLAHLSNDKAPEDMAYVLIVEDAQSGERSRVGVTLDYILSYPQGSVYQGEEGVIVNAEY